jgi:hypothetical protein
MKKYFIKIYVHSTVFKHLIVNLIEIVWSDSCYFYTCRLLHFFRLSDHLNRFHHIKKAVDRKAMTARQRDKKGRSAGGRGLFMCRFGACVVKKTKHLRSTILHPELKGKEGNQESLEAFKSFKKVRFNNTLTQQKHHLFKWTGFIR